MWFGVTLNWSPITYKFTYCKLAWNLLKQTKTIYSPNVVILKRLWSCYSRPTIQKPDTGCQYLLLRCILFRFNYLKPPNVICDYNWSFYGPYLHVFALKTTGCIVKCVISIITRVWLLILTVSVKNRIFNCIECNAMWQC